MKVSQPLDLLVLSDMQRGREEAAKSPEVAFSTQGRIAIVKEERFFESDNHGELLIR